MITAFVGCGAGAATSVDGTSPAIAVAESAHAKAKAITKRFIVISPYEVEDAGILTANENRSRMKIFLQGLALPGKWECEPTSWAEVRLFGRDRF